jgi:CRP-like cAMP-binding protein
MAGKGKKASPSNTEQQLELAHATVEELSAQVLALRTRVELLEGQVDTWKRRAAKHKSRVQQVTEKAEQAIAEATAAAKRRAKAKAEKKLRLAIADHARDDHPRAEPVLLRDAPGLPQPSWTLTQLRAAARDQGVTGYSRLTKAQLLDILV